MEVHKQGFNALDVIVLMNPADRIIFALDYPTIDQAQAAIDILGPYVGGFKVGLELFIASKGRLPRLTTPNKRFVLDLKLHDIPETVERAIKAAATLDAKPDLMTLHVQQRSTMERAVECANAVGIQLLAVTVLTSMVPSDLEELGYRDQSPTADTNVSLRVRKLATFCASLGAKGFVCSPMEIQMLKQAIPDGFFMVPGVRPAGHDSDDQKRVGTPAQTVRNGADLIVIGRPIRDSQNMVEAAKNIAQQITEA